MAGSFSHIVDNDGNLRLGLIENGRDAAEALHECFHIIRVLSRGNTARIAEACRALNFSDPWSRDYEPCTGPLRPDAATHWAVDHTGATTKATSELRGAEARLAELEARVARLEKGGA